jgi:PAS domain S-box-containing protein
MNKQEKYVNEATLLRLIAEEELKSNKPSLSDIVEFDHLKLIHELQVHQIELEMQNEELKTAHNQAYEAIEKYVELYDYAPSGYLSLSKDGDIIELNYSAAYMLGDDRNHLKDKRFGLYISHDSLNVFNKMIDRSFRLNEKEDCELILLHKTDIVDKTMCVHVDAHLSKNRSKCLITMTDISERKKLETKLSETVELLRVHNLL